MQVDNIAPIGGHLGGPKAARPDFGGYQRPTQASPSATGSTEVTVTGMMKAGDVFPDLHHKMSKKIAQLTKVIYHLNTKNEDRQASQWTYYCETTSMLFTGTVNMASRKMNSYDYSYLYNWVGMYKSYSNF